MTNARFIIPWRDGGDPYRRRNFDFVWARLSSSGLPGVSVSDQGTGPFNRSRAYNNGYRLTRPCPVYVWHEADMLVPHDQLEQAIELAAEAPGLVVPFTDYHILNPEQSDEVMAGADPVGMDCNVISNGGSIGAVGVTSEATMQLVGQWDENFAGWGFDDNAMHHAFTVCAGPTRFVPGSAWHLWHPSGAAPTTDEDRAATAANQGRLQQYLATRNPQYIRELTGQRPR